MRAITSLPPPAAKPTMMWIGRLGYLEASSCASTGLAVRAARQAAIRPWRVNIGVSEPRDMNMQRRRLAVVKCGEAAVDRGCQLLGVAHAFAVRAERFPNFRKIPPLALPPRHQPRLELVGRGRDALRIDALGRGFHRLPAAIVEDDGENRDLVLLCHRIDAVGRGEVEAAVADHLHDAAPGLRELQSQRHAAGEAEAAAGESDIALRLGA